MKTANSVYTHSFYNSASSLTDAWYDEPRRAARKKLYNMPPASLEAHEYKQEVVCSVILAFCLLFAFAHCIIQFAVF